MIIKSIYEKNVDILEKHYLTCKSKHCFITEHSNISIIDKEIVNKCYKDIKKANQQSGSNIKLDREFLTFITNYLDFCQNKITLDELFAKDFTSYRSWLKYIYTDNQIENGDVREDFKFLFEKTSENYFNRIHRDQHILNKTRTKRRPGLNNAGLTPDEMSRLN